jgi:hypothetical protein
MGSADFLFETKLDALSYDFINPKGFTCYTLNLGTCSLVLLWHTGTDNT